MNNTLKLIIFKKNFLLGWKNLFINQKYLDIKMSKYTIFTLALSVVLWS